MITVWHGDADRTVVHANAHAIVDQWRGVYGIDGAPARSDIIDGHQHRVWLDDDGSLAVEEYRIGGLGHGTPLASSGPDGCGHPGAFMLEAGISSTYRQAESWGLIERSKIFDTVASKTSARAKPEPVISEFATGITNTIEQALRSAGLMR